MSHDSYSSSGIPASPAMNSIMLNPAFFQKKNMNTDLLPERTLHNFKS